MTADERLTNALRRMDDAGEFTPCQGKRSARWTSDDYAELEWAAFHCVSMRCPLLDLCGQAADERREKHFTWGGTVRSPKPRRKAA